MKRLIILISIALLYLVSCKQEVNYTISTKVQPPEGGSIIVTPSSGSVLEGTSVSFTANPNGDYVFTGWSGSISGTENPKTVTVTSDMSVVANFTLKTYPLTLSVEGEGTVAERVISTKTEYGSGTVVELTANPSDHWLFDHWEGDLNGNTNPVQITVSSPKSVKAVFVKKMYDLTVNVEGEGAVSETVKETRSGSYQEGTVVELTATPATGWSFDHWEGDLSGSDNPVLITISGSNSVKAIFTKNKYAYNLKIVGPGVVDEYLLPKTKADFDYGTKILLKAIPSKGAVFKGWSGDVSDDTMELVLNINEIKNVVATFSLSGFVKSYPLPDLKQPWSVLKSLYKDFDYRLFSYDLARIRWLPVDYNRDGYLDVITAETFKENYYESDCDIHFYIGNPDGTFALDSLNDGKFVGKEPSKMMYSDFNNDDIPDILLIGSGTEQPGALMGTYPMILMSSFSGAYDAIRFENLWGYNQGTIGDIDNDGDMDIVIPNTMDCVTHTLINDGTGAFSVNDDLVLPANDIFPVELFDVNHDGYLDLIWGGGAGEKWDGKTWRAEVIWGDGTGFRSTNPISIIHRWDLISFLDFEFMDFDQDGVDEIIVPLTSQDYSNWELAVFKMVGDDFSDVTSDFFEPGENIGLGESWIVWIDIEEDEGKLFLVCQQYGDCRMYFEYKNEKFLRADEDSHFNPQNGFAVYYDAKAPISSNVGYTLSCPDNPNSGDYCIMNEPYSWGYMFKLSEAQNGTDLRQLVSDGYCIEFYARHDAPDFLVEVKFGSEAMKDQESNTFSYPYWGNEHASDGKWQRIVVPLSSFDSWNDETGESWGRINYLFFHAASETNKCPFYIDEIRIRKILSE